MIAKHVPMKSVRKSDFAGLVKYLIDEQQKRERVTGVSVTNCHADWPAAALLEVLNTQAQNRRAESDKTYHLIVSFRAGEQPDAATLQAIERRICEGLGYGEHQRVSTVHQDTDNLHLHIAINKIHPTRYTIHDPYRDHKTLGELCEKLESEYGLQRDNHQAQKRGAENRADDMERHAGIESLLGWIRRECLEQIQGAENWAALHQVLRDNGLEIRERGNGLVIADAAGTMVKASSVAGELSRAKLEARLGSFEPSPERLANQADQPTRQYQTRPVRMRRRTAQGQAGSPPRQLRAIAGAAGEPGRPADPAVPDASRPDARRHGRALRQVPRRAARPRRCSHGRVNTGPRAQEPADRSRQTQRAPEAGGDPTDG